MNISTKSAIALFILWMSSLAYAVDLQEAQYQRAVGATKCEPVSNNGLYCEYQFGRVLEIGIKDVGGSDTVIGFHNSNIENELYAVMYLGCVSVVPGKAHPRNYGLEYGVHISPRTGHVYRTSSECRESLKK